MQSKKSAKIPYSQIRYIFLAAILALLAAAPLSAGKLVILQTNDTHSQIDPTDKGMGGIQRRKVVVDSIRAEYPNVLLIDSGDAVQGTLFFTIYGGEVEMKMMNELGYDIAILGNHDFDNGVEALARNIAQSDVQWLSTNYNLRNTPLSPFFRPYAIKEFDGKRVGIIALNLNPKGMIAEGNYDGVEYLDAVKAANATAWHLKNNEDCDLVVAVTHIGYDDVLPSDLSVIAQSEDIDLVLGGHSHTMLRPGTAQASARNSLGREIPVAQNGKSGGYITEIVIDLDSIAEKPMLHRQIAIDKRLDSRIDHRLDSILAPYRKGVDEMMSIPIGRTAFELNQEDPALLNFIADFVLANGKRLADNSIDLAITNKGSLRRGLPKGTITLGQVISMQPFENRTVVLEISGKDLLEAFNVMAARDGDGVSHNVCIKYDPEADFCTEVIINGRPLDPDAVYRVATIDYLANGGDYMAPLTRGTQIAKSENIVYDDLIHYIKTTFKGKTIKPSKVVRMAPVESTD